MNHIQSGGEIREKDSFFSRLIKKEDWWAVWLAFIVIASAVAGVLKVPLLPKKWGGQDGLPITSSIPVSMVGSLLLTGLICLGLFSAAVYILKKEDIKRFLFGFPILFILAVGAYVLGNYSPWRHYGINDVIWALVIGLIISNTIKTPKFLKGAIRTELYIKTGLVLLGASILFNRVLTLGAAGIGVAWIVTPIVIFIMYWYSQKVLMMHSKKSLAITIVTALSVCGVSAAIAAGTAARAKKEEISLAISISLIFTVVMMLGLPLLINAVGIDPIVGGAWIGGTVDATGAVVASGAMLGDEAKEVAAMIKMVQNILIGVIAFSIAAFWKGNDEGKSKTGTGAKISEIWIRTPKFIIGFVAASLLFSFILPGSAVGARLPVINGFREIFFTLTFLSIGLDSNLKELASMIKGGKALKLYVVGQSVNLVLTLIAAYIFFSGRFFTIPF